MTSEGIQKSRDPLKQTINPHPPLEYLRQTVMRYIHTNLVARDWKKLAEFYKDVFDCVEVLPERGLSGQWLDHATGLRGARAPSPSTMSGRPGAELSAWVGEPSGTSLTWRYPGTVPSSSLMLQTPRRT